MLQYYLYQEYFYVMHKFNNFQIEIYRVSQFHGIQRLAINSNFIDTNFIA